MSEMLTKREFAAKLRVGERAVERWVKEGKLIPGRTPGGAMRFSARHIEALLQPGIEPSAIQDRLSVRQFAAALCVPAYTVERWIAGGDIVPAIRLPSGKAAFSREQLDRLLKDKAEHPERAKYKPRVASAAPPKSPAVQLEEARRWIEVKLARHRLREQWRTKND